MDAMQQRREYEERQRQEIADYQKWDYERAHWIDQAIEDYLSDTPDYTFVLGIRSEYGVDDADFERLCLEYIDRLP